LAATTTGPSRRSETWWLLTLLTVGTLLSAAVAAPAPADAHAAGELPTARLSADGDTVTVQLTIADDDAALIGTLLGQLPEGAMEAYLGRPDEVPSDDEVLAFSASPELRAYLLDHVAVSQDGSPCEGTADPAERFVEDGAVLTFRCPAEVTTASIRISVLHDQDEAYRTYSVDGTEQFAVHSPTAPEHEWDFTLAGEGATVPASWLVGLAAVVVASALLLLRRRPRRHRPQAAATSTSRRRARVPA
jgi:hypothetical protein